MYRLSLYLLAALALAIGLIIGTLNSDPVGIDLFWYQLELPLGAALVLAFVFGSLLGLFTLYVFRTLPLSMALRRTHKKLLALEASNTSPVSNDVSLPKRNP